VDFTGSSIFSLRLTSLRACGADEGPAPAFGVDDIARFLAPRQIVFLVWVDFGKHKWSILAERRGAKEGSGLLWPQVK